VPFYQGSLTQQIAEYVRANPGALRADIIAGIGFEGPPIQITSMLGRLKRGRVLRSEGPYPKVNRWYPNEITSEQKYQQIASDLLSELKDVHGEMREVYLAKRLEEIFES
jgi:hypothetical protein